MLIYLLISISLILIILRQSFFIVEVSGSSMEPTFKNGNLLLAFRLMPKSFLKRSQIVVCELPKSYHINQDYIVKRIKACPGDNVHLGDCKVMSDYGISMTNKDSLDIPAKMYLLQGDGKSANVLWGPVDRKTLIGIVLFRLKN